MVRAKRCALTSRNSRGSRLSWRSRRDLFRSPLATSSSAKARRPISPPARGQNSPRRGVRTEPVGAVDGEQPHEPRACTTDPALDRPYRDLADRSRLLVGEARRANEKQDLALAGGQLRKRRANFLEFQAGCAAQAAISGLRGSHRRCLQFRGVASDSPTGPGCEGS
jgi:hypothetical protein